MSDEEIDWGMPQNYGTLKIKYIPTGEVKELKLGIRRMSYHNELIFCNSWGYDGGSPTDLNNPDNYEVISIEKFGKDSKKIKPVTNINKIVFENIMIELKENNLIEANRFKLMSILKHYKELVGGFRMDIIIKQKLEIDKKRLIEMMTEFWAIDNNETCGDETYKFLQEIGFTEEDIKIYFQDLYTSKKKLELAKIQHRPLTDF